jgi:PAS domain S-box-containing protein
MIEHPSPKALKSGVPLVEALPSERRNITEVGAFWATGISLLLVLVALVALAFVPPYLNRRVAPIRSQIQETLRPAERLAAEIELAQTQQIAALEAWVFSGEGRFRQRYLDALAAEEEAFRSLRPLTEGMDLSVREALAGVTQVSFNQLELQLEILAVLNEEIRRETFREEWAMERVRFDEILSATLALRQVLSAEAESGQRQIAEALALEVRITRNMRILVFFGLLVPLLVLLFLGWRLRTLMLEAEAYRRAATRARREAAALLEATGDGVLGMDRDGRCVFLNRAGSELLGYPIRLVQGRDVHDLIHHSHPDGTRYSPSECPVMKALEEGEGVSGRNETLWGAERELLPVQISVRALRDGSEIRGAVLTFTDMREARAAEANLRQALQARDEVLGVVSHDLRNPVGTIFSSASLLLELELSPEKHREHLAGIKRSAGRMNLLIEDLLDVARMEAGALRVTPSLFHLQELLEELVAFHRGMGEEDGVSIHCRLPDPGAQAWGDRNRVFQLLSNLVDNALKFTPTKGTVEVGARVEPNDEGVLFWVTDSGAGIAPESQARLFDRFWQVGRRDKRGAGLGLSIVKGLVEAHGGRIWVESEVGKGSTFLFVLPQRSSPSE